MHSKQEDINQHPSSSSLSSSQNLSPDEGNVNKAVKISEEIVNFGAANETDNERRPLLGTRHLESMACYIIRMIETLQNCLNVLQQSPRIFHPPTAGHDRATSRL